MWTGETRQRHARVGLRYPSDLTDAEWARMNGRLSSRIVRRHAGAGGGARWTCARSSRRCSTSSRPAASGVICPRTSPRAAPSGSSSISGATTARSTAFTRPSIWPCARRRVARPRRPRQSSTARPSRRLSERDKRLIRWISRPANGGSTPGNGLRRGQEDDGRQAPCTRRHPRPDVARGGPPGQHGSGATAAWPAMSNTSPEPPRPWSNSP